MNVFVNRKIIFSSASVVFLILLFYFAFYGFRLPHDFRFPPCEFTNETVVIPQELIGATILLENDQYVGRGKERGMCGPLLKEIENKVINSEDISNITVGKEYFESVGLTVEILKKGKQFQIEHIVAQTRHGLGTIISGRGPIYFLILRDEIGDVYEVATVSLGTYAKDSFFSVYKDGIKVADLSYSYFRIFYGDK